MTCHGSAYLFTRQKFMTSAPFLQPPGTPKPDLSRYNFGGTVGGPIVHNRVFDFVNYERWMADAPTVSTFNQTDAARLGIPPETSAPSTRSSARTPHRQGGLPGVTQNTPDVDALLLLLRSRVAE